MKKELLNVLENLTEENIEKFVGMTWEESQRFLEESYIKEGDTEKISFYPPFTGLTIKGSIKNGEVLIDNEEIIRKEDK